MFDIGSASVAGALVRLSKGKNPKVMYSVRENMAFQEKLNAKTFSDSMLRTLNSVVSNLETKGLVHLNFLKMRNKEIQRAFCFVSSPWNVSQTKVIKMSKDKKFTVSEEMMKSMISSEIKDFINLEKITIQMFLVLMMRLKSWIKRLFKLN